MNEWRRSGRCFLALLVGAASCQAARWEANPQIRALSGCLNPTSSDSTNAAALDCVLQRVRLLHSLVCWIWVFMHTLFNEVLVHSWRHLSWK